MTFLTPPGEPFLVLEEGDDDLGDAQGGDGEIVGAKAQADLPGGPGRARGQRASHQPGKDDGQAEASQVAGDGRLHGLDGPHRGLEERPRRQVTGRHHQRHCELAVARAPHPAVNEHRGRDGDERHHQGQHHAGAARLPSRGHRRHRDQHSRQPAERGKAHDAGVEQSGVAPLDVHAQGHDGRDQAQVQDGESKRPALRRAHEADERRHDGEQRALAGRPQRSPDTVGQGLRSAAHDDFPLKIPVGFTSSTTTRMKNEIANL